MVGGVDMSRKLIVTGGLGFIGKNFCRKFSQNYASRLIIDKLTYASDRAYYDQYLDTHWSLTVDNCKNIEKYLIDYDTYDIVHFAAESHVDNSFSNARNFFESNVMDTLDLLEAVRKRTDKVRLLHISTDEVYGERIDSPAKETARLSPTNPYSASKTSADILVQTFIK
jgi:dTDP-glucose 4,6-dehydratase